MNIYFTKRNGELLAYLDEISWEASLTAEDVLNDLSDEDFKVYYPELGIEQLSDTEYKEVSCGERGSKDEIQTFINLTVGIDKIETLLG